MIRTHQKPSRLRGAFVRGVLWLLVLGPLFFLSYNFANQRAARLEGVPSFFFEWERAIPFWPWTIIFYWSIDLLYGLAFLCCRDKAETNRLGLRYLAAQVIAISCFLLWPLRFAFERPPVEGFLGAFFNVLTVFDLPYNQSPSLHIAVLVIMWRQFATLKTPPAARFVIHGWAILIGVSVLTTWQHHFIDIPTGLAAGLVCLWLWPDAARTPLQREAGFRRFGIVACYGLGAALALTLAITLGGVAWLLLGWIALALALTAFNYAWAGATGFQKNAKGHSLAVRWLFAPYMLGAWINSRLWTRRHAEPDPVAEGLWLGRLPTAREFASWAARRDGSVALFDLTAELPAPALPVGAGYGTLPCLDLLPIPAPILLEAARRIEHLRETKRDVWIACAPGYSRSALVAAAYLYRMGKTASVRDAVALLRQTRPQIVLGPDEHASL
ncbi:MAG: phosphatase PAP2/dual specificity phosphatase family protein, partial [Azoarcus sp.]|nr:phosphatase PAP2/dual specificity phosphatase family protein [Azoarcus sp.]